MSNPFTGLVIQNPVKPVLRPTGLLVDVATELDVTQASQPAPQEGEAAPTSDPNRWMAGVRFIGADNANIPVAHTLEWCDYNELIPALPTSSAASDAQFAAFNLWNAEVCSAIGVEAPWLYDRTDARVRLWTSYALAYELLKGTATGNPNLEDATVGAAVGPREALFRLESAWENAFGNIQGTMHMSPALLTLMSLYLDEEEENDEWVTPSGHNIISDAAYANSGTPGTSAVIYMTGPVAYKATEPVRSGLFASLDLTRNLIQARSSATGLVVFDPDMLLGVTVNITSGAIV